MLSHRFLCIKFPSDVSYETYDILNLPYFIIFLFIMIFDLSSADVLNCGVWLDRGLPNLRVAR